jgi:hypothetical protein
MRCPQRCKVKKASTHYSAVWKSWITLAHLLVSALSQQPDSCLFLLWLSTLMFLPIPEASWVATGQRRAVNCQAIGGVFVVFKIFCAAISLCNSLLHILLNPPVITTSIPRSTITVTPTIVTQGTGCVEPLGKRAATVERRAVPFTALAKYACPDLFSACSCLSLHLRATTTLQPDCRQSWHSITPVTFARD